MHTTLQRLEEGLKGNHTAFTPNTICANAALTDALRFGTGASQLAAHIPALHKLTGDSSIPICDGVSKSGGTLMKTVWILRCAPHHRCKWFIPDQYFRKSGWRDVARPILSANPCPQLHGTGCY